ncbi:MAG: GrpB family protein [Thermomicrobiales bacterium]
MTARTGIQITPYDPDWPDQFRQERDRIEAVLHDGLRQIEHIGSTSVPGLDAKPIIDIQAEMTALKSPGHYARPLAPLGYRLIDSGENDIRVAMHKREGVHANLHIVGTGSWVGNRTILLRDALRSDRALARQYAALKYALARDHNELHEYTMSKSEFIEAAVRSHCAATGIPYSPGNRR